MLQKRTEHIYNKKHCSQARTTFSQNFLKKKKKVGSSWDGPFLQFANNSIFSQQCIARFHTQCQHSIQYNRKKKHKNVGSRLSIYLHGHGRSQDSVKNPDGLNKTKIDAYNTDPHAILGFVQKEGGIVLLSALGTMSCKAQQ